MVRRIPIQNGKGIGSIFRSISRFILPAAKKIISSPLVKQSVKKLGKQALKTGVQSLGDVIEGNDPGERIKQDIKKIGKSVGKSAINTLLTSEGGVKKQRPNLSKTSKKRRKRASKRTSIYDRG